MKQSDNLLFLEYKAYKIRLDALKETTAAGSGHLTSALSAADIVAALFFHALKFNPANPHDPNNDRFVLSKGHAVPVVYAAWKEVGVLSEEEILTYRKFDSVLEGHPTSRFIYNEAATGSLGTGLSIGLGMALSARLTKRDFYTYVMLGDSEMTEGSVWEGIEIAAHYAVDKLVAIVDFNRLGQSTETIDDHHVKKHAKRWEAFGWHVITIDGHDMGQIVDALDEAKKFKTGPVVIIAKTLKGYGLDMLQNKEGYHGKAMPKELLPELTANLHERFKKVADAPFKSPAKVHTQILPAITPEKVNLPNPTFKLGDKIATRKVYGQALALVGQYSDVVLSLDAEVKNSTFAEIFEQKYPHRFIQCYVAEQNMISMAIGLNLRGFIPFCSTFSSFMSRAHDQIRMAAIGRTSLRLAGSHCGVSIGQDGPSQMGLEDIAIMRALPDSIVLYPSDAVSAYKLVNLMVNYHTGISYLRLTREGTDVLYAADEKFTIGGCKIVIESDKDVACIVAAGITVYETLKAYNLLKKENISISIIDLYSVKPLDYKTLLAVATKSGKKIITVEDHYLQGGLGEAVCYALRNDNIKIEVLAVDKLSKSGKPEELLAYHKIDARSIVETVKKIK